MHETMISYEYEAKTSIDCEEMLQPLTSDNYKVPSLLVIRVLQHITRQQ